MCLAYVNLTLSLNWVEPTELTVGGVEYQWSGILVPVPVPYHGIIPLCKEDSVITCFICFASDARLGLSRV
jgi:hypothetical protein